MVLDIGCGPGASLGLLRAAGINGFGLDGSDELLGEAGTKGPVLKGDAMALPFKDAVLDGVLCECVLSLMQDKSLCLREIRRVLKKGGKLLLNDLYLRDGGPDKLLEVATCRFEPSYGCQPQVDGKNSSSNQGVSCLDGAEPLDVMKQLLKNAGFAMEGFSDETRALKELAVKLIFRFGSPAGFFGQWGASESRVNGNGCSCASAGRERHKPGYAMLVAVAV